MPHCANEDCPDRARLHRVEFRDDIDVCPRCRVPLSAGPPPVEPEEDDEDEYVELADVATFMYVHEAELAASHLAAAGIDAHIVNRDTLGIHSLLSVAMGGVRVQVAPEDLARARQVLTAEEIDIEMPGAGPYRGGETSEPSACPDCGSTRPARARPRINWFALLSILLLGIPLLFRPRRCRTCGAPT